MLKFLKILLFMLILLVSSSFIYADLIDFVSKLDFEDNLYNSNEINNGTASGSINYTTGARGTGKALNCSGGFVNVVDTDNMFDFNGKNVTMSFWSQPKEALTGSAVLSRNASIYNSYIFSFGISTSAVGAMYGTTSASVWNIFNNVEVRPILPNYNTWEHFVIQFNSSNKYVVYKNGVLKYSGNMGASFVDATGNFVLCQAQGIAKKQYIDEFIIWNRQLSSEEINTLYVLGYNVIPPYYNITLLQATPSDITTSNALGIGLNLSYFANTTNLNYSSPRLNWSISSTLPYWEIINGTPQAVSQQKYFSFNSSSLNFTFHLDDNEVYPGIHNLDPNLFENTPHSMLSLSASDYIKTKIVGINDSFNYSVLELMVNGTGVCRIFYCNSSYTTGIPGVNPNCNEFGDQNGILFNHSSGFSFHNIFNLGIFNRTIGGVGVTNTSYFLVKGVLSGGCTVGYINNRTTADTTQTSTNLGVSYTNQNYTADLHVHQLSGNEILSAFACIKNTSGSEFCSSVYQDNLNLTLFPPTNPVIFSPNENITDILFINFSMPTPQAGYNISRFEVYLLNTSLNTSLLSNNSLSLTYTYNITQVLNWSYNKAFIVMVKSYSSNGLFSTELSETFFNVPLPPSELELSNALLSDINQSLHNIRNTQEKDSGGINMIGLYILMGALTIFSLLFRNNPFKIAVALLNILISFKAISLGGYDAMIGVGIIAISVMMIAIDFDN